MSADAHHKLMLTPPQPKINSQQAQYRQSFCGRRGDTKSFPVFPAPRRLGDSALRSAPWDGFLIDSSSGLRAKLVPSGVPPRFLNRSWPNASFPDDGQRRRAVTRQTRTGCEQVILLPPAQECTHQSWLSVRIRFASTFAGLHRVSDANGPCG